MTPGRRRQVEAVTEVSSSTASDLAAVAAAPQRDMKTLRHLAFPAALAAGPAYGQAQPDPAGSSPLLAALTWVQGTLLGNLATTAAVIAVAIIGYLMLTGRFDWRRGMVTLVGIFIIFGAAAIVAGIRTMAAGI